MREFANKNSLRLHIHLDMVGCEFSSGSLAATYDCQKKTASELIWKLVKRGEIEWSSKQPDNETGRLQNFYRIKPGLSVTVHAANMRDSAFGRALNLKRREKSDTKSVLPPG